jgi:hypothetical protein
MIGGFPEMRKKKFSPADIKRITGAKYHEPVKVPFYYAPPFLDQLREVIEARLASSGGRPTLEGAEVERTVRFLPEDWKKLKRLAEKFSEPGKSISPSQVASTIVNQALRAAADRKR